MSLYRKKPVTVEAMQWFPREIDPAAYGEIVGWLCDNKIEFAVRSPFAGDSLLIIPTLEGDMAAEPGDWIIKGVAGKFYPCQLEIFEATYEKIEVGNERR